MYSISNSQGSTDLAENKRVTQRSNVLFEPSSVQDDLMHAKREVELFQKDGPGMLQQHNSKLLASYINPKGKQISKNSK